MKELLVVDDMYSGELLRVDFGFDEELVDDNVMYIVGTDDEGGYVLEEVK